MMTGYYTKILELDLPWELLKDKKVLVTGANGMIASSFVEAIMEANERKGLKTQVYALCRSEEKAKRRFFKYFDNETFHLVVQDVVVPLNIDIDFDYIVHAASSAYPEAMNKYPVDIMKANFIGTLNLLEYSQKCSNCRFLFVSSSEVYGENFEDVELFSEDNPGRVAFSRFRACYPESKRASETLCHCYKKQYDADIVITRPAFIYGKNILDDNSRADVYFMRQAMNKKDIVMFSKGEQIRSYCYVKDCISGMLYILLKGESGETYNIGDPDCVVTLHDYAQKIADVGGVKLIVDEKEKPDGLVFLKTTKLILDTTKLKSLGWKITYNLDAGLKDIFEEWAEEYEHSNN